jgi:hypothetical protein
VGINRLAPVAGRTHQGPSDFSHIQSKSNRVGEILAQLEKLDKNDPTGKNAIPCARARSGAFPWLNQRTRLIPARVGGGQISGAIRARTGPTFTQGFFLRPKVSSVRNPLVSWPPTVHGENDCCIRYLPTTEKGRGSSSKKPDDLFSARLLEGAAKPES